MTSCTLQFVFEASAHLIKLDHNFKVLAEMSCQILDMESMSIGVKLSMERLGDPFQGCCKG